jgi:putative endonuclease
MHFVYVIYSENLDVFYKGYSSDISKRLFEHNNNLSKYTSDKGPWKLLFVQEFSQKREALIRERSLKKCNKDYFLWLTAQPYNIANRFQQ